jgi:UDP-N-acetylglucosamine 4-epimerase
MPKVEEQTGRLLSPYAVSKKTNELYASVFSSMSAMRIIGLRYFNIFGPRQDVNGPYAAVIPLFIEAMLSGKQATIFGDGENSRDFTFVDNAVQANVRAALSDLPEGESPVLNIAFGGTTSLNTLHRMLAEIIGHTPPALHASVRKGDIRDSFADISKARNLLGYTPAVGLEEGLRKTVEWFMAARK